MNSADMLAKLLSGKKVRRSSWPLDHQHAELVAKSATNPNAYVRMVINGKNGPFAVQSVDILASDWVIVA